MTLKALTELTWRLYQNGKAYANNQHALKPDIQEKCKLAFADGIRQMWYQSKASDDYEQPDYSFTSPLLNVKRFSLGDYDETKRYRRCDMSGWDMYRMPGNSHITNVYPVGTCGDGEVGTITQVNPGEENFYVNDPDIEEHFFVIKGKGINAYNLPPCVKELEVESTFDLGDQTEIDKGLASMVCDQVLGVVLGIKKQYYSEDAQKAITEQNLVK